MASVRTLALRLISVMLAFQVSRADAGVPENGLSAEKAAFAAFTTLALTSRAKGTLPRLSDPVDRSVLEKLWDRQALLGSPPYTASDVPALGAMTKDALQTMQIYLYFTNDNTKAPDPGVNSATFQDEMSHEGAFMVYSSSSELLALEDLVHRQSQPLVDRQIKGVHQIREGFGDMVKGLVAFMGSPVLHTENRDLLVDALADSASSFAAYLTLPQRDTLKDVATNALPTLSSPQRARFGGFISALADRTCNNLCQVQ